MTCILYIRYQPSLVNNSDSPVELGLKQRELASDLDGVEGHQVEVVHLARPAEVPLDRRGRALEGDAVADAVGLRLQLPLDDLVNGLHPLSHGLACRRRGGILRLAARLKWGAGVRGRGEVTYPKRAALTSELDFAGDVLLELSPQLWIVLKVVEMMFDPLAENVKNPARQNYYYNNVYIICLYNMYIHIHLYTHSYTH